MGQLVLLVAVLAVVMEAMALQILLALVADQVVAVALMNLVIWLADMLVLAVQELLVKEVQAEQDLTQVVEVVVQRKQDLQDVEVLAQEIVLVDMVVLVQIQAFRVHL
jgi:hypothetical protein